MKNKAPKFQDPQKSPFIPLFQRGKKAILLSNPKKGLSSL
jgi:hypothetical protein